MKQHKAGFEAAFFATAALWVSPQKEKAEYRNLMIQAKTSAKALNLSLERLERISEQNDFKTVIFQGTDELKSLSNELCLIQDSIHSQCFLLGMHCGNLLGAAVFGSHLPDFRNILPGYMDNIKEAKAPLPVCPPAIDEIIEMNPNSVSFYTLIPLVQNTAEWLATSDMSKLPTVFLSYAEEESGIANSIGIRLKDEGISCWLYKRDSQPGEPHLLQTGRVIDSCKVLLVIISVSSIESEFVAVEIFRGYEKKKAFLPVLVGLTNDDFVSKSPKLLLAIGYSTTIQWSNSPEVLNKIIDGVRTLLLQR